MARSRTRGIFAHPDGTRDIDKRYGGERIRIRLGIASQEEAEARLRAELRRIDEARQQARGDDPIVFASGAARYLSESAGKSTAELLAYHVSLALPHIGAVPLDQVCDETLEPLIAARRTAQVSNVTINRTLEVVRAVLTRCARAYRAGGRPWLRTAPPLITMLPESAREPWPLSWPEQDRLFAELPEHLRSAAEFAACTGARDDNVAGLQWAWEQHVAEAGRSVFVVPPEHFKGGRRAHVMVLSDRAWELVQAQRGKHATHVWCWRRGEGEWRPWRDGLNNTAWQAGRARAGLRHVRVHDLRHTFATRLRAAGVSDEDRATLMGHAGRGMPQHYAAADVVRMIQLANRATERTTGQTVLRVIAGGRVTQAVTQLKKKATAKVA
jgi:integrase